MYEVALATGLRRNEIAWLRPCHLNPNKGGLNLDGAWTKDRESGFQPLSESILQKLVEIAKSQDADAPLVEVPRHTARDLDKDLKRAKILKWGPGGKIDFHALRVTFVTMLFECGANPKEAQSLARHKTLDLTMNVYARARDERRSSIAGKVGEIIEPDKPCQCFFRGTCINPEYFCLEHLPVDKLYAAIERVNA